MYRRWNLNFTCHKKFLYNFICLFPTVLSLRCCSGCSLAAPGCSLVVKCRILLAGLLLSWSLGFRAGQRQQLWCTGLVTRRHMGSSPCLLPGWAASNPACHPGSAHAMKDYSPVCFILGFFLGGGFQPLKNVKIIFSSQAVWVEIRFSQQAPLNHFKATATPARGVTEIIPLWIKKPCLGVFSDCL